MRLSPMEFEATREKLDKINARAEKRGFTGRFDLAAEYVEKTRTNAVGLEVTEVYYDVEITGEPPSYGGWRLLAALDFEESGVIVRTAPGVDKVNRDRLEEGKCDHCRVNRPRRKSFVVGNDEGDELQVGSTCLKDFLGWDGHAVFVSTDDVQSDLEDHLGSIAWPDLHDPLTVLSAAWAAIKVDGFVSRSAAHFGQRATADTVNSILYPPKDGKQRQEITDTYGALFAESHDNAVKVRDFVLSDEFSGDSEYVQNLKVLAAGEYVSPRHIGLLASAPQAMARHEERTLAKQKDQLRQEFYGTVGDKIETDVKIKAVRWRETPYGSQTVYTMVNREGYVFKWYASRDALGDSATEEFFKIKGTVKKHDEWKDMKSTVLTRCKAVE